MHLIRRVLQLLDASQRRHYVLLQGVFLLAAMVQLLSVASIAPFIALLSEPELIHLNRHSRRVYDLLSLKSDREFLVLVAFALMGVIVVTNAVQAWTSWLSSSFARRVGAELQADIFRGYLYRDYAESTKVNSARMIRTLMNGTSRYTYMVLQPTLSLVGSAFVLGCIALAIGAYNPVVASVAAITVGGAYGAVYVACRSRLRRFGTISWSLAAVKQRVVNESLGGLKQIRIAGTGPQYEAKLQAATAATMDADRFIGLLTDLPRFALEALALCALLGLGVALLVAQVEPAEIVPILSVYAMAGYRMLPAAQTVFRSWSLVRANEDVIEKVGADVRAGRAIPRGAPATASPSGPPIEPGDVEFRNVSYRYPGTTADVISNASFTIPSRAITALVGPSGAGKSTAVDLLLGLLVPQAGKITVGGRPILDALESWRALIGYVPQDVFLLDDTIAANIAMGSAGALDEQRVERAARLANVLDFAESLPGRLSFVIGERGVLLSGGQRQRIGIARALYNRSSVLVLDEPTSALDSVTEGEIVSTLESLRPSTTIVMVAHRLSTLRCADHIVLLDNGHPSACGTFDELMRESALFRRLVAQYKSGRAA